MKESGTEIGPSLEFDFVVPPPHSFNSLGDCWRLQIKETLFPSLGHIWSLKANKDLGYLLRKFYPPPQSSALSTQPLRLARQFKGNWEARTFVPASIQKNPPRPMSWRVCVLWKGLLSHRWENQLSAWIGSEKNPEKGNFMQVQRLGRLFLCQNRQSSPSRLHLSK